MSFYFLWSWIGLVIAIFMIYLLFFTDKLRSNRTSRFKDGAWYAWLPVPIYLLHQFEEYACHITNGQFDIVSQFFTGNLPFDTSNLPLEHFPLVNISLVWFGAPLAAILFKKNSVIGFSYFGFMFLNGITHLAGGLTPATNPGVVTGVFLFIPSAIYMIILSVKEKILSTQKIILAFMSGILAHIFLFLVYFLASLGKFLVFTGDILCGFAPIIFAYLGLKFLNVK